MLVLTFFFFFFSVSSSAFRSLTLRYSAASVIDTSSKYKFLWKLPLEDVEVVKSKAPSIDRTHATANIVISFFQCVLPDPSILKLDIIRFFFLMIFL